MSEVNSRRGLAVFSVFSLLSVFAHEFAAVTLLVVILGLMTLSLFKRQMTARAKRLLLGAFPALVVFVVGLVLRFLIADYSADANVIWVNEPSSTGVGGLFFLENYLVKNAMNASAISYGSYWDLALNVSLLFGFLFLSYLFLVIKGFFRSDILDFWTGLLLVGALSCLVVPFAALTLWYRWMFMLVYPFTFYAINGVKRLTEKIQEGTKNLHLSSRLSNKRSVMMVMVTFGLGIGYLITPGLMIFANTSLPVPPSVPSYFSTSPTVPYEDVGSVTAAMCWLNNNTDDFSGVILQHFFLFFGQLYLGGDKLIFRVQNDVDLAVHVALDRGVSRVYFVYWNQPIGWPRVDIPAYFVSIRDFGRISVYACEGESCLGR